MSIPVGPGDLVMLVKGLWKLAEILQGGAEESFRRCAKTYKRFALLSSSLNELIDNNESLQRNEFFNNARRGIDRMLRNYFKGIRKFERYLGRGRVDEGLLRAIAKLRWVRHSDMLEELREELEFRFAMVSPFVAMFSPNCTIRILHGTPTVPGNVPRGNHFVLEDARRIRWAVYFSDAPDWNHFHRLLGEQIFPKQDRGHSFINSKSYVLRNISTSQNILPGSPGVKLLRGVINPDDRMEMNVIVPYDDEDTDLCPRCGTERGADGSSSLEVSWYVNLRGMLP
ncbi:uncharacterized protein B0H64DRAFT_393425 [Chaetomium fimeti]|uniref:Uncharacterized protein n=1 Tax=Chaetomium fimeti TaxID=1854472 RepID=A0AAE0LUM6_9PEZI|nr:hypothetical protein B0H64DRAFT_393425 [Chaetomium fimeti]